MNKSKRYSPPKTDNKKFVRQKMYHTLEWTEYRAQFLQHNPKCYACADRSTVVDHIVAHKEDKKKFWDVSNFIPLCKRCHDFVTGSFDKFSVPKTTEKMRWLAWKRMETETTVKVIVVPMKKLMV